MFKTGEHYAFHHFLGTEQTTIRPTASYHLPPPPLPLPLFLSPALHVWYAVRLKEVVYGGIPRLRDALKVNFSEELGLPVIQETDLGLLDDAISLLNPPQAQFRVVEVDTFTVRGHDGCVRRPGVLGMMACAK